MAAEAAERNPDKNKYKALAAAAAAAMAAAVFSLLVFCVASRFVSYWTAAKGKREERGEEGREAFPSLSLPLFGVSPNLFVGSSEKKLPETISPFPNFLLLSLRSFQD